MLLIVLQLLALAQLSPLELRQPAGVSNRTGSTALQVPAQHAVFIEYAPAPLNRNGTTFTF
jgi:hypothetical protein